MGIINWALALKMVRDNKDIARLRAATQLLSEYWEHKDENMSVPGNFDKGN